MARRAFRPGVRTSRRRTDWSSIVPETTFTGLAAATAILDSTITATLPTTLIRSVGQLTVTSDQQAVGENPFGAVGLCVVSDQSVAIGVTALPTPYTDPESDLWLFHQFWSASMIFASAVGIHKIDQQYKLESKAMRKMSEDQTLCLIIENGSAADAANY